VFLLIRCLITKKNILEVPDIVKRLSSEGIWSITTPLQVGADYFEYSDSSSALQCQDPNTVKAVALQLYGMAKSGRYLMHNAPEYYAYWNEFFIPQNWHCSKKNTITVDADGSLKRCVDIKGGLERFNIMDLEKYEDQYEKALEGAFECKGCYWDPAVETTMRGYWDQMEAIKSFRHELTDKQLKGLNPEARRWFEEKNILSENLPRTT
jgi:hypothetical protein